MKYRRETDSRLVYSTDSENEPCGEPEASCRYRTHSDAPAGDRIVRIRREVKGRQGKTVTAIAGIRASVQELDQLASDLKRLCGSGGSAKDGIVLIQGDHRDKIKGWLEKKGYTVKLAGG